MARCHSTNTGFMSPPCPGPCSSVLGQIRAALGAMAATGHEDAFLLAKPSGCFAFSERTFAGSRELRFRNYTTKFEFVINMTTEKELSLSVPPALIARADEIIE